MSEDNTSRAEARAADLLVQPAADDGRPDLADMATVEQIVRDFLMRQVAFRAEYLKDPSKGSGIKAFVERQAEEMRDIFLGEDQRYHAAAWNSEAQLGQSLAARMRMVEGKAGDVLAAFFTKLAADFTTEMAAHEAGQIGDDDSRFQVDVLVEEAVYALLGMRLSAD